MDKLTAKYREAELMIVAPLEVLKGSNGQFALQLTSERGKTKYLNITPQEFKNIEKILLNHTFEVKLC